MCGILADFRGTAAISFWRINLPRFKICDPSIPNEYNAILNGIPLTIPDREAELVDEDIRTKIQQIIQDAILLE